MSPRGPWGLCPGWCGFLTVDTLARDTNLCHWPLPIDRKTARRSAHLLRGMPSFQARQLASEARAGRVPMGTSWPSGVQACRGSTPVSRTARQDQVGCGDWHTPLALPTEGDTEGGFSAPHLEERSFARVHLWYKGYLAGGGSSSQRGQSETGHPGRWPEGAEMEPEGRQARRCLHGSLSNAFIKCLSGLTVLIHQMVNCLSPALGKPGRQTIKALGAAALARDNLSPSLESDQVQPKASSLMGHEIPQSLFLWSPW